MREQLRYLVVFEHTQGTGYSAWVPDLPGCAAAATTRDECELRIRAALALHLAGMQEDGEPVPKPSAVDAVLAGLREDGEPVPAPSAVDAVFVAVGAA